MYSLSTIWLREAHKPNLPLGASEADKNLTALINLIKLLFHAHKSSFQWGAIDLEGVFQNESPRIYKALFDAGLPPLEGI